MFLTLPISRSSSSFSNPMVDCTQGRQAAFLLSAELSPIFFRFSVSGVFLFSVSISRSSSSFSNPLMDCTQGRQAAFLSRLYSFSLALSSFRVCFVIDFSIFFIFWQSSLGLPAGKAGSVFSDTFSTVLLSKFLSFFISVDVT